MSKKETLGIKRDINVDIDTANLESFQSDSILNDTEASLDYHRPEQEADDEIERLVAEFAEEVEDTGSETEEHIDNSCSVLPITSISRWTLESLAEDLLRLNIGAMTPLEALEFLSRWYSTLYSSQPRRG